MERNTYLNRYRVVTDDTGAPVNLGHNGPAVMCKAEDIRSGAEVAVEVIPAFGLGPQAREELEREAAAARELEHINIPRLHAFDRTAEQFVYAWEYFDGTSGEEWIREHGPMPIGPALRIALQIVSALGAAAFHSLVHRAINPRNVILVPGQTPQGEWPLVKIVNLTGVAPTFRGSEAADFASKFASPEQLENGGVDFRSEMYSLGATLWFLMTGGAPVAGANLPRASGISKPVAQLLAQMLSPNADERPYDPLAFQEQIRECLGQVERREATGRKMGVPVPAAVPVIKREPRRAIPWKPLLTAALVLLVATLVALLIPENLRPNHWFAGFGKAGPIGVPIGVPESSSPTAEPNRESDFVEEPSSENTFQASSDSTAPPDTVTQPPSAPTLVSNASASPSMPENADAPAVESSPPAEQPSAIVAQSAPPAPTEEADVSAVNRNDATSSSPSTVANQEEAGSSGQVARTDRESTESASDPAPPSEGPATPATVATSEVPAVNRVPEEEEEASSPAVAVDRTASDPAPAARHEEPAPEVRRAAPVRRMVKIPPREIEGREVRVAEPVDESEIPGLPARSRRARFLGFNADGAMVFEMPSSEEGFARPRR